MNTRHAIDDSSGPVSLFASFNQDRTCFVIGHENGFCVYESDTCALKNTRDFNAGIGVAEMLGRSNLVALVGGGSQPKFSQSKVTIWDDISRKAVITLEFRTPVKRVRLSRSRIVVALQNNVYIYEFVKPGKLISRFETADNEHGLCALSQKVLAFVGRTPGQVQTVEANTGNVSIIPAHGTALRALEISTDGSILATASEKGTLIRVFSTYTGTRVAEFRRGVDPATIFSIGVSPNNSMLAVTSDKSTLHLFDLPQLSSNKAPSAKTGSPAPVASLSEEDAASHKWGFVGKIPFLPRVFSDEYSFASVPFETGDDPTPGVNLVGAPYRPIPGIPGGRAAKGIIGWLDDQTILILGTGRDGRWEKFVVGSNHEGKRYCQRQGWKRYLGN